jgi:hypothetical protein
MRSGPHGGHQFANTQKSKGVSLHIIDLGGDVTGNGIAKFVFAILSAVPEVERDRICERVAVVKADQKIRGRYRGASFLRNSKSGWEASFISERSSQPQIRQTRVVSRTHPLRPSEQPVRLRDRHVVDAGVTLGHVALGIEAPILVAVAPPPLA